MNAGELIEKLSAVPPETKVIFDNGDLFYPIRAALLDNEGVMVLDPHIG